MGNDWVCPCTEREKLRKRLPKSAEFQSMDSGVTQLSLVIKSVYPSKLNSVIQTHIPNFALSSITSHPLNEKALLFFLEQPKKNLTVLIHQFKSTETLKSEIQAQYNKGFQFVGGINSAKGMHLVFSENTTLKDVIISVRTLTQYRLKELRAMILEEEEGHFVGSIECRELTMFVFEKNTGSSHQYFVAEFPKAEVKEKDFEKKLEVKIHDCINDKEIVLRACVTHKTSLYLIFIRYFLYVLNKQYMELRHSLNGFHQFH